MNVVSLRPDCANCASLCCVALPFDRSTHFAFDKAGGEPCPNLDSRGRCGVYTERDRVGFSGCVAYDCLGAGQRVTGEIFAGRSWRDDPSLLAPMSRAFGTMRRVHELLLLLNEAGKIALAPGERKTRAELERSLRPETPWTAESLGNLQLEAIAARVNDFLASLRGHFIPRSPPSAPNR